MKNIQINLFVNHDTYWGHLEMTIEDGERLRDWIIAGDLARDFTIEYGQELVAPWQPAGSFNIVQHLSDD